MILATVKKPNGTYLDHGNFSSEEAALTWFQPFIDKGVYGKPAISTQVELTPAVLDEQGNVVQEATFETVNTPAEFVIEFQDIASIPKTQEEINSEARAMLNSTDWILRRHQDQLLSNETPSLSEPELQTLLAQRKAARESIV